MLRIILVFTVSVFSHSFSSKKISHYETDDTESIEISGFSILLEDDTNITSDIDSIVNKHFVNYEQSVVASNKNVWCKLKIRNTLKANKDFVLYTGNNPVIQVFVKHDSLDWIKFDAGLNRAFNKRIFAKGRDSKILLHIENRESMEVYLKIVNNEMRLLDLNLKIYPYKEYLRRQKNINLLSLFTLSIISLIFVLALLVYITQRTRAGLYYAVYLSGKILFILAYSQLIFEYVFTGIKPNIIEYIFILDQLLGLSYVFFAREILQIKQKYKKLNKLLLVSVYIKLLWCIMQMPIFVFTKNVLLIETITICIYLLDGIFALYVAAKVFDRKNKISLSFISGVLSLCLFQSFSLIAHSKQLDIDSFALFQIGIILEILFFAYSLILALKVLLKEKQRQIMKETVSKQKHENRYSKIWEEIEELILKDKLYLNPDISLDELALRVQSNATYVSQTIKENTQLHFNNYINKYRIKEAKKILEANENISIKNIYMEVGFKSKSSFYTAFKKFTKLTPSEYKKELIY